MRPPCKVTVRGEKRSWEKKFGGKEKSGLRKEIRGKQYGCGETMNNLIGRLLFIIKKKNEEKKKREIQKKISFAEFNSF